jgi:hypothetical protein
MVNVIANVIAALSVFRREGKLDVERRSQPESRVAAMQW